MDKVSLSLPAIRCLSKEEAACYLGIGVTLLTELEIPFTKLGRRCLYDRVDLDAWIEEYKQREHGRAKEENIWPKPKKASTGGQIHASGGLQLRSQTAKEYAKVLGLKTDKTPKHC
ncbi:helix-turn-helix domain-containing protein [Nitrosomonas sp. Nm34]|uniref:helix-turn-helix domain-containing protein n=1 Tax=Nitrosomonas sp. Nm34 TaxID=1881055 RepID=UPI0020C9306F|nr:helix-turn-helix domain-containing protein [Nitrosomonas sp. Nm34]